MQARTRLSLAAVILVPVLLYWGFGHAPSEYQLAPPEALDKARDAFMNDVSVRQFNRAGQLSESLDASRIEHDPARQLNELTAPRLRLIRADNSSVTMTSVSGTIADNRELVLLAGSVRVQDNRHSTAPTTLTTELLKVYPGQDRAETDRAVTIRSGSSILRGIGMQADLAQSRVKLLSNVQGTYKDE